MSDLKNLLRTNSDTEIIDVFDPEDLRKNKGMAALSYFSWFVLIPILFSRSPFARYHANQGLLLFLTELLAGVVFGVLKKLWLIGWLFRLAGGLVGIFCFLLLIYGVCGAVKGKARELPLIGGFRLLK